MVLDTVVTSDGTTEPEYNNTVIVVTGGEENTTIPEGVENVSYDLTQLPTYNNTGSTITVTIPNDMNIITEKTSGTIAAYIDAGTNISANASWDGKALAPTVRPADSVNISDATKGLIIEVGHPDIEILLDKPMRMFFEDYGGYSIGFERGGVFTQITRSCNADTQLSANTQLTAGQDCKISINGGTDLVVWTRHWTKFVPYSPDSTDDDSSSSSGSSGGYSSGFSRTTVVPKFQTAYSSIQAGKELSVFISKSGIAFTKVQFIARELLTDVNFIVEQPSEKPETVTALDSVYAYLEITTENVKDSQIKDARVNFRVPADWIADNSIDSVVLYRWFGNNWQALDTEVISSNADSTLYAADSPGFSYFAIAGFQDTTPVFEEPEESTTTVDDLTDPEPEPTNVPETTGAMIQDTEQEIEAEDAKGGKTAWIIFLLIVILVSGLAYIYFAKANGN